MASHSDVIILGLGAMGSAAAYHLARHQCQVVGLDTHAPPHSFGSSHGRTRVIREAYFEHPAYVPLVQHAYTLWDQLAEESEEYLFMPTGAVMLGSTNGVVVPGALASAREHGLTHELLQADEVHHRFPALHPTSDMVGVWEPRAGMLFPERCIESHLQLAQRHGAQLHYHEPALSWKPDGDGVTVQTNQDTYHAQHLVLSAGAWAPQLLPDFPIPFVIERQPLFWFETGSPELFHPDRCPIYFWEHAPQKFFYGFPFLDGSVKVAEHHGQPVDGPDNLDRTVHLEEKRHMQELLRPFLPGLDGPVQEATVCMYTNTPDGHFLIDQHPAHPNVLVVSPCSGHGFKFSAAIGQIVADQVLGRPVPFDLSLFRLNTETRGR